MKITSELLTELERTCGEGSRAWIEVLPGSCEIGVERADGMKSAVQDYSKSEIQLLGDMDDVFYERWEQMCAKLAAALHAEDLPHG